jgi:F-type H+-transporting ATPase subunit epsilon
MADTFQVEVVAADRRVWEGEATQLVATTTEGEIGVLAHHVPLIAILAGSSVRPEPTDPSVSQAGEIDQSTTTAPPERRRDAGPVVITTADGRQEVIAVDGGFLAVETDRTVIISPYARRGAEISLAEAQAALRTAQGKREAGDMSYETTRDYHRAIAQVKAASRKA